MGCADVAAVIQFQRLDCGSLFRCDEDNAVGSARAVYCGCRAVFQHVDTLDILGCDCVEVARNTVDEDEGSGIGAADSVGSAHTDLSVACRVARGIGDGKAGDFALNELTDIFYRAFHKIL